MGPLTSLPTRSKSFLLLLKRQQSIYKKLHLEEMQQLQAIIKKTQRKIHPFVKVVERKSQNLFVQVAQTVGIAVENVRSKIGMNMLTSVRDKKDLNNSLIK